MKQKCLLLPVTGRYNGGIVIFKYTSLHNHITSKYIVLFRESEDSVNFTLTKVGKQEDILQLDFNKLAIKALHMKLIKQQLEQLNVDVIPKNMHNVSLGE